MTDQKKVLEAVKKAATEHSGMLPCAVAQEVARELQVPMSKIGLAADELGIKIVQCQLGCFK